MSPAIKMDFILGTRPEVIKLAPLILEAKKRKHHVRVIMTGQHKNMTLPLLKFFGIKPDIDLKVMKKGQTLTGLSQNVLKQLDNKIKAKADMIFVQGDTTSVFLAAYWGFCNRIPVMHVEAGLRTYDLTAPFPEEGNRQLVSRIADLHFAPTQASAKALYRENIPKEKVFIVGNTGIDALLFTLNKFKKTSTSNSVLDSKISNAINGKHLVLVTAHRRESFGPGMNSIALSLKEIAETRNDICIVYPVHPNPQVREPIHRALGKIKNIVLCEPLNYIEFVDLMSHADVLLTDSGGIQEEGPTLRKPILVMREKTERPEGVKAGFAKLVGTNQKKIVYETLAALKHGCQGRGENPYGDGHSAKRILDYCAKART